MWFTQLLYAMRKRAHRTNSTFGFANTQANAKKPKELFFAHAQRNMKLKCSK